MKILVTGNLGYVGSHLTRILIDAGHEVIGCDLSLFSDSVCDWLATPSEQFIRDFRSLTTQDLIGVDAIAHLAGISNDPMGELDPGLTSKINGAGSVNLAKIARDSGVRIFAFASSCSIYGSAGDRPRTEVDRTNPLSEYAASKLYAEVELTKISTEKFRVYLLRNATAYGASSVLRTDLVVNDLSVGMHVNGIAEVKSDGTPWRPLIHCLDMARAFKEFIEKNPIELSGSPINIGFNHENFQVRQIASHIKNNWPKGEIKFGNTAVNDSRNYQVSFDRLKKTFPNFEPKYPLVLGVPDLKNFLQSISYSESELQTGRYVRLVELRQQLDKLN
jgi:nucleoside-diphosphate-sugar epimerase